MENGSFYTEPENTPQEPVAPTAYYEQPTLQRVYVPLKKARVAFIKTYLLTVVLAIAVGLIQSVPLLIASSFAGSDATERIVNILTTLAGILSVGSHAIMIYGGYRCYRSVYGGLKFFTCMRTGEALSSVIVSVLNTGISVFVGFDSSDMTTATAIAYGSLAGIGVILGVVFAIIALSVFDKVEKKALNVDDTGMYNQYSYTVIAQPTEEKYRKAYILLAAAHIGHEVITSVISTATGLIESSLIDKSSLDYYQGAEYQTFNSISDTVSGVLSSVLMFALFFGLGYKCYKNLRGTVKFFSAASLGSILAGTVSTVFSSVSTYLLTSGMRATVVSWISIGVNILVAVLSVVISIALLKFIEKKEQEIGE